MTRRPCTCTLPKLLGLIGAFCLVGLLIEAAFGPFQPIGDDPLSTYLPPLELGSFMAGVAVGIVLMGLLTWGVDHLAAKRARAEIERQPATPAVHRRRNRDAFPPERTDMIQREITPGAGTGTCDCGRMPKLIESRGNPRINDLAKARVTTYHFECPPCGIATERDPEQLVAQAKWNASVVHPITATRLSA